MFFNFHVFDLFKICFKNSSGKDLFYIALLLENNQAQRLHPTFTSRFWIEFIC